MHPETLLVSRKERKKVTEEAEKEGMFLVMMIEATIVGEYIRFKKVMNSVVLLL